MLNAIKPRKSSKSDSRILSSGMRFGTSSSIQMSAPRDTGYRDYQHGLMKDYVEFLRHAQPNA